MNVPGTVEIATARPEATAAFWRSHERESLRTLYAFTVVWHEQRHDLVATIDGGIVGALRLQIAASLAHVVTLVVDPQHRRRGIGRALVLRAEEVANYYNCHKVTLEVPAAVGEARAFFAACDYRTEAILPQHTFKLDVAVLRKFLL